MPDASKWPPDWKGVWHSALVKLPSNFLMLVGLIVALGYFVHIENRNREKVYAPLLQACLDEMKAH